MGTAQAPTRGRSWRDELAELEDVIRDAVITGVVEDRSLAITLDLIIAEQNGRPLFPSALEEPVFYRQVKGFVLAGIEERAKIEEIRERASSGIAG